MKFDYSLSESDFLLWYFDFLDLDELTDSNLSYERVDYWSDLSLFPIDLVFFEYWLLILLNWLWLLLIDLLSLLFCDEFLLLFFLLILWNLF